MCFLTIVMGSVIPFVNIKINTLIMKIVDKNQLSKVNSIISLISQGLIPFASVMAGAVLQFWGTTILLFIGAAGFVVSAIYLARQPETRTF